MAYNPVGALSGGNDGGTGPTTTHTLTLPGGAAAGDLVLVQSVLFSTTATATISSGNGQAWDVVSGPDAGYTGTNYREYLWSTTLQPGDVGASVTVTWSASAPGLSSGVEYPPGSVSASSFAVAAGGAASITATGVSATAGDSIVQVITTKKNSGGALPTVTVPSGYTSDKSSSTAIAAGTNFSADICHKSTSSTGTTGADTTSFSVGPNGSSVYAVALTPVLAPTVVLVRNVQIGA